MQKECKRISPNFRYFSTKYNKLSFEIRRIFETPTVSVKTKIRKAARIFERNIAETQQNFERNFEIAHRKFTAKIRLVNERLKTLFVDFHLLILPSCYDANACVPMATNVVLVARGRYSITWELKHVNSHAKRVELQTEGYIWDLTGVIEIFSDGEVLVLSMWTRNMEQNDGHDCNWHKRDI